VVDANESACGLARFLAEQWNDVVVRRLQVGDVAIGDRVVIERKAVDDYVASLGDGRLFRQAARLAGAVPRPALILEGDRSFLESRIDRGALRGVELAITIGFRIPVLYTGSVVESASYVRHMAAQEARREARRRRNLVRTKQDTGQADRPGRRRLSPEAFEALLSLPGVGLERARAIAEHAGSLGDLCRLGFRDLLSVPGVGADTAARIVDGLRGGSTADPSNGW
jgi:Fanconi anemia group M protein